MTLLFIESFDHHGANTTDMNEASKAKWGGVGATLAQGPIFFSPGRQGAGSAAEMSAGTTHGLLTPRFSDVSTIVVGFAFRREVSSGSLLVNFRSSGTTHCTLSTDAGGVPVFLNSTITVLGRGTTNFRIDKWYYVECKVTISNTVGAFEVRVNDTLEISDTNVDTQVGSTTIVNELFFPGTSSFAKQYDDIYVLDTAGSVNNDFLGDRRVEHIMPEAAGANTDFALTGAPANWEAVDDNPFDSDSSYVSTGTLNDTDTYNYEALPSITQNIAGIQTMPMQRKDEIGSRTLSEVTISGATTDVATAHFTTDDYQYNLNIRETDPNTAAAWTQANLEAAEFGIRLIS